LYVRYLGDICGNGLHETSADGLNHRISRR
jgi:hypothetical protein